MDIKISQFDIIINHIIVELFAFFKVVVTQGTENSAVAEVADKQGNTLFSPALDPFFQFQLDVFFQGPSGHSKTIDVQSIVRHLADLFVEIRIIFCENL